MDKVDPEITSILKDCIKLVINAEARNVSNIPQKGCDLNELDKKIQKETSQAITAADKNDRSIQAYFIGSRGQNIEFFSRLIQKAINSHLAAREEYEMEDDRHITRKIKNSDSFLHAQDQLETAFTRLLTKLKDLAPPFFSTRYFGHMNWETTIPAIIGNFATMLYNPNNCAFEGGPLTTILQIQVIKQFAQMFDYPEMLNFSNEKTSTGKSSWGHLTCGGTVANCQALWAARNCRFLTLSVRKYIESLKEDKNHVKNIKVILADGTEKKLLKLNGWQILNVSNEQATNLYDLCFKTLYGQDINKYSQYQKAVSGFSIGERGLIEMYDWIRAMNKNHDVPEWKQGIIPKPIVLGSATAHYSLKKSLSILGLGKDAFERVFVDLDSRICIQSLKKKLQDCLAHKRPLLGVIAIIGTTEQSTVDNIVEIVKLRKEFLAKGLYFHFHIDGAYGGYFVSMIRNKGEHLNSFSDYVADQLKAICQGDSITFDPHKTGYVPYTCGGIIYKNHRLRNNLSFSAPYIYTGAQPNMAIYGIEGSKPGSSVSSVYLSLQVLPLVRSGHGALLERTLKNTKVFTGSLYTVQNLSVNYKYEGGQLNQKFQCLLLPRLQCQKDGKPELRDEEIKTITMISKQPITELSTLLTECEDKVSKYYYGLGPDLNIVCYGLNFTDKVTKIPNRSLKKYNQFNRAFIKLSKPVGTDVSIRMKDLYVSQTQLNRNEYGPEIFEDFLKRHNLENDGEDTIVLIRSTIMNAFFTEITESGREPPNEVFVRQLVQNGCQTLLYLKWR